ncbi:hypothetical protein C1645_816174 [Glomus cerebriforme]|uniref:Uncharacterized protein n=1 Tax=Glomus cerebriforme TaxID=658196 RepID=A0A397THC3_9GLOM|nr:hypothetical protein C1645_816174 [Glomus cerebriforme]
MKSIFFLFLLTTLAAVNLASNYPATGEVTCTATSCDFSVKIIGETKEFKGTSGSFGSGRSSLSGVLSAISVSNMYENTTNFNYDLEPFVASIAFIDGTGNKLGGFAGNKDNPSLNGTGNGNGKWG